MIAYIPARGGSKRVPRKNIRILDGQPVLARTIEHLIAAGRFREVYVSTDDAEIAQVAEEAGAKTLAPRREDLADDETGFIELIHKDLPRYTDDVGDRLVCLALATAALVPPEVYAAAADRFGQDRPDVLMSSARYSVSPLWALQRKADGFWSPVLPEYCFTASKDLPETAADAGLFYIFDLDVAAGLDSLKVVDRLQLYPVQQRFAVDVDEPEDWEVLEQQYALISRGAE